MFFIEFNPELAEPDICKAIHYLYIYSNQRIPLRTAVEHFFREVLEDYSGDVLFFTSRGIFTIPTDIDQHYAALLFQNFLAHIF
ncbi:hypothetical protein RCL_jg1469.t1 [Rhizophagus clarus]|uniref:Uncharacterized protein n=1 Tax=Rhizophagus clarus TaxID=94130 RepID=A0A8H3L9H1_9GLOM|nr:hypothetical protein RCL_jg1469.t1 [Rhizophagus clarus]